MTADPLHRLSAALAERYAIERRLGRGGMATFYLARDLRHDRPVALKVLHPELASSLGPGRFLREIKLAARLEHPHILLWQHVDPKLQPYVKAAREALSRFTSETQ